MKRTALSRTAYKATSRALQRHWDRQHKPRKAMRQQSAKQRAAGTAWTAITTGKIEAGELCAIRSPACTALPSDGHHRKPRGRGRDDRPCNHVLCCRECHDLLKISNDWAEECGYTLPSLVDPEYAAPVKPWYVLQVVRPELRVWEFVGGRMAKRTEETR